MQLRRFLTSLLAGTVLIGVAGCGTPTVNSQSRNRDFTPPPVQQPEPARPGMSNRNKVLLLAGAAALYYLYNKHKDAPETATGSEGRYYRSKNGRIYYRDKNGRAVWVTPPTEPIRVPAEDYERYTGRRMDDYDGRVIREAPAGWS